MFSMTLKTKGGREKYKVSAQSNPRKKKEEKNTSLSLSLSVSIDSARARYALYPRVPATKGEHPKGTTFLPDDVLGRLLLLLLPLDARAIV
jgi:hypothetical protein